MKKILIFGIGCPKCQKLAANAKQAAAELEVEYELEKITGINDITRFGVMATPAIAIDGAVKCSGKLASVDEIKEWLQ
ncbi:MAG: TM0996/MTH895 family glutaredoxin-like protein [Candidatus Omnitrophica bacterium]|nr:TM0996/MTH895 family glutaredoxin-like protein [Candidatus Omnitrophota bacterium]